LDELETTQSERHARLSHLVLDGDGPLWLQIRRAVSRPILSGAWRPGSRVPGELALTEWFQTSRMTVAKAMQSLANEGVVERRRKIGTVVSARAGERPVFEIWDTAEIVERRGSAYGYELLSCALVGDAPEDRAQFGVARAAPLIRVACLHTADGRPFQVEDRLISLDAAPDVTCELLATVRPGPWLLSHVPWTQAEHAISAHEADERLAGLLDVRKGASCLLVERRTWNGEQPVTLARLWQSGAEHRLVGRFEPSAQPA
jgi:GntR family histidine utilization transcriptional repressor